MHATVDDKILMSFNLKTYERVIVTAIAIDLVCVIDILACVDFIFFVRVAIRGFPCRLWLISISIILIGLIRHLSTDSFAVKIPAKCGYGSEYFMQYDNSDSVKIE